MRDDQDALELPRDQPGQKLLARGGEAGLEIGVSGEVPGQVPRRLSSVLQRDPEADLAGVEGQAVAEEKEQGILKNCSLVHLILSYIKNFSH